MNKKKTAKKLDLEKIRAMSSSWDDFMREELADPKRRKAYLEVSIEDYLEDNDVDAFLESLQRLAKAKGGMAKIARKTGLSRESLYRTLSRRGNPQFRTVLGVIDALGMRVRIEPAGAR